jgi:hypothetical protein
MLVAELFIFVQSAILLTDVQKGVAGKMADYKKLIMH